MTVQRVHLLYRGLEGVVNTEHQYGYLLIEQLVPRRRFQMARGGVRG